MLSLTAYARLLTRVYIDESVQKSGSSERIFHQRDSALFRAWRSFLTIVATLLGCADRTRQRERPAHGMEARSRLLNGNDTVHFFVDLLFSYLCE
jgi:hypothetical protein